jgi:DNA-binding NarL/FixJ family response regulator
MGLVSYGSGRRYGEEDLRLAEGLAHCAALALDNARHRKGEAELARELVDLARGGRAGGERRGALGSRADAPELTARQLEVLGLLAEGKGVAEIRKELYLSEATVRNHVRALLQALSAHSQLEAVARARKVGLLSD